MGLFWPGKASADRPPRPGLTYRVGVIGHPAKAGDPFDGAAVRSTISAILSDIGAVLSEAHRRPYDIDVPPSLTLISTLAEGAEQIAAQALDEVALPTGVTCRLEVVTPFARDAYVATSEDAAARQALEALLERADAVMDLADWAPGHAPDALAAHRQDKRNAATADLVLRQADLLIAVWDGRPTLGAFGPGDAVISAIGRGVPIALIAPATGEGRVLGELPRYGDAFELIEKNGAILDTNGVKATVEKMLRPIEDLDPAARRAPSEKRVRLGYYLDDEQVHATCRWFTYERLLAGPARHRVNMDAWKASPSSPRPQRAKMPEALDVAHVRKAIVESNWPGFPEGTDQTQIERLRQVLGHPWASADAIATRLGHIYRSTYVWIFMVGALAVICGLVGLFIVTGLGVTWVEPAFSALELACLGFAIVLYVVSRKNGHHGRWMQARALSEQIRAHWALALLGVGGRRTLGSSAQWSAWLFNAYAAQMGLRDQRMDAPALARIAAGIRKGIVEDQIKYHKSNEKRLAAIHDMLEGFGHVALVVAAAVAAVLFLGSLGDEILRLFVFHEHVDAHPKLEGTFTIVFRALAVLAAILPAIGAALAGVRYHGDFERFSERSGETALALARIDNGLVAFIEEAKAAAGGPSPSPLFETLRDIATDLERVLLSDLEDWRFVYRARPMTPPG